MSHTKFIFNSGEGEVSYKFWTVHFLTGRADMVLRTEEDQAPMVVLEATRKSREVLYLAGKGTDRLQDAWDSIEPISEDRGNLHLASQWIGKLGEKFGFTGFITDASGTRKRFWHFVVDKDRQTQLF